MKKSLLLVILMTICIVSSCCEEEQMIIGSGNLFARSSDLRDDITTVDGAFILLNVPEVDIVSNGLSNHFTSHLYATSCVYLSINSIPVESMMLSCDKPFLYDNQSIGAHTNILLLNGILTEVDFDNTIKISFTEEFIQKAEFDISDYLFQLQASTTDGLKIENNISLLMNIHNK